jgi:ubiquinone/menaquinone biosynthesis C-methylase UbiE
MSKQTERYLNLFTHKYSMAKKKLPERYKSYLKDNLTKKMYKNVIEEYTSIAKVYEDRWAKYLASTEEAILQQLKLKGKEAILDAGCGTGTLITAIQKKFKHKGKIYGFDITPAMLELAEYKLSKDRFNKSLQLELAHCENFSAKKNSIDIVIFSSVMHHLPHPEHALKEFQRVLKKNGKLIFVDYCTDYPTTKIYDLVARMFHKAHHKAYSSEYVEELLKKYKFKITTFKTWKATPLLGVMLFSEKKCYND